MGGGGLLLLRQAAARRACASSASIAAPNLSAERVASPKACSKPPASVTPIVTWMERSAAASAIVAPSEAACDALERLGCGAEAAAGRTVRAFARFHGTTADAVEALGRGTLEAALCAFGPA